jgi:hypothetical protein
MNMPGIDPNLGQPMMAFRTAAIAVAIVSGICALVALLVGSPLEFGVALASCGLCWVAADSIEWTVQRERAAGRQPVLAALLNSGYGTSYPARVGAGNYSSRPPPRAGIELARSCPDERWRSRRSESGMVHQLSTPRRELPSAAGSRLTDRTGGRQPFASPANTDSGDQASAEQAVQRVRKRSGDRCSTRPVAGVYR